jgi:hypothetical protein
VLAHVTLARALEAKGESGAAARARARTLVEARAARIADEALRRMFLEENPEHRAARSPSKRSPSVAR